MSNFGAEREEACFSRQIDQWVEEGLSSGHRRFGTLVSSLPGVDPGLVRLSLDRIARADSPVQLVAKVVLEDCRSASPTWARTADRPVPHPLDYFWGYGERSIGPIVDRLTRTTSPGDRIVYLGAPNAFDACADVIPDRSHVLLDRRDFARLASMGPNREFRRVDLLIDEVPHVGAKAGVVDPPWYPGRY
jgi:hypothetical protein